MRVSPTQAQWLTFPEEFQRQYVKKERIKLKFSSGIGGELTCGWGDLDANGYWGYPCDWVVRDLKERHGPGVTTKKEA